MLTNLLHKITGSVGSKVIVLMYHRIASLQTDPWQLAVNTQNFEHQLQILKRRYHVISSNELIDNLSVKKVMSKTICITFDDAYSDNYLYAKPILENYQCPATFFVPSAYIGLTHPFWWDELENIILHSKLLPSSIRIFIQSQVFELQLIEASLTEEIVQKHKNWIWTDEAPTKRCELYLELWRRLQPLPYSEISTVLEEIKNWAGYEPSMNAGSLPMSSGQLAEMCNHPLFDIGVHTSTHPALAFHNKEVQRREISNCREYLEKLSGRKINSIAYPYGNYNETTLSIVMDQGFSAAFTTQAQAVTNVSNPLLLGRFQVLNQNKNEFKKQLQLWNR